MPTTRPRVPGWHPDPEDPASLRHWDGRRWGNERRPRPSWAPKAHSANLVPGGPGGPGGSPGGPGGGVGPGGGGRGPANASRRRWYLLATGALLVGLVVISVPAWLGSGPAIPPQTVSDAAFTGRADAACSSALPKLRQDRPESREDTGSSAAFAARIERAATALEALTADLRAIPVATAPEGAEVDRWLDDWDAYTSVGHRFAAAIGADKTDLSRDLSAQGQVLAKRIYVFAKANDMPNCTF